MDSTPDRPLNSGWFGGIRWDNPPVCYGNLACDNPVSADGSHAALQPEDVVNNIGRYNNSSFRYRNHGFSAYHYLCSGRLVFRKAQDRGAAIQDDVPKNLLPYLDIA